MVKQRLLISMAGGSWENFYLGLDGSLAASLGHILSLVTHSQRKLLLVVLICLQYLHQFRRVILVICRTNMDDSMRDFDCRQ